MALKSDFTPHVVIGDEPVVSRPSVVINQHEPLIASVTEQNLRNAINGQKATENRFPFSANWHRHSDAYFDDSPIQPFMVAPAVMGFGHMFFIAGAPKVGKTDFMLHMLSNFAAGRQYHYFTPLRPLRIAYLQCEVTYNTFRLRMRYMGIKPELITAGAGNFVFTDKFEAILTPENMELAAQAILSQFPDLPPDIIAIDPMRNVFDGGPTNQGENSNDAVMYFLRNAKSLLRDRVNPNALLLVSHHTRKPSAAERLRSGSIFDTISGASSIRSMYDGCILILMQDDNDPNNHNREIHIETRHAIRQDPAYCPPNFYLTCKDFEGAWAIIENNPIREDGRTAGFRKEREEKDQVIMDFIYEQAEKKGMLYTKNVLAKTLSDTRGLGSEHSINTRLDVLLQKWKLKVTKEGHMAGLQQGPEYLVAYDIKLPNGRVVIPTHCKSKSSSGMEPINNPQIWQLND